MADHDAQTSRSGDRGPRPWSLAAAGLLVAAVAAAGVVVVVFGGGGESSSPAGSGSSAPVEPDADADAGSEGGAGSDAGSDADGGGEPLSAAPVSEWVAESGVWLPVSEEAGPAEVDGSGVPSGFAHSPEGALLAAAQIALRTGAAFDPEVRAAVVEACVAGPEADVVAFAEAVAAVESVSAAEASVVAGFDYLAYDRDEALVELVMDAGAGGVFAGFQITVVWAGGDWALQAPPGGDWNTAVRPVADLDLYTPWGP